MTMMWALWKFCSSRTLFCVHVMSMYIFVILFHSLDVHGKKYPFMLCLLLLVSGFEAEKQLRSFIVFEQIRRLSG